MLSRPVLHANDVVPFFINVVNDSQRLFEVVQQRLDRSDALQISISLVRDFGISPGFTDSIVAVVSSQLFDYERCLSQRATSDWAVRGSAVHVLSLEAGIDGVVYSDTVEWDIFDESADPDAFARLTAKELCLPVEFVNVISAQIRWQVIRFRCMHCFPEKLAKAIENKTIAPPQTTRGLRHQAELLDASPVVGLVPGVTSKKSISSLNRQTRHLKRQGHTVARGALQPADDPGKRQVKLIPIVRAAPMPEDSPAIDLAEIPLMIDDDAYDNPDLVEKVRSKFKSPLLLSHNQVTDESGSDTGSEDR